MRRPPALVVLGFLWLAAACGREPRLPEATPTAAPPPAVAPRGASVEDVEATVREVSAALDAARGLRDALRLAPADPNWDRVVRACRAYPLGPTDPAFGVRLTQGLQSQSARLAWWPEQVIAIDAAAATTCFVTGSASAIPPGSRVEAGGLTTAEIAAQPLQAALDDLRDASPQALRALVESRARAGT